MKKIGLITSFKELNYGAVLQAFALQDIISSFGNECNIVWLKDVKVFKHHDIRIKKVFGMAKTLALHPSIFSKTLKSYGKSFEKKFTNKSVTLFEKFKHENLMIELFSYYELKQDEKKYDLFVCGSDQIWNSYAVYMDPMYYLRFTKKEKRFAYAPSFGKSDVPKYNEKRMREYLSEFSLLSTREEEGANICENLIGKKIPVVCDPTFLINQKEWKEKFNIIDREEKYILVYFLDEISPSAKKIISQLEKEYEIKYIPFSFSDDNYKVEDAGPIEFLDLIYNAQMVLTDSFHGTAFSINFNKNFYVFKRNYGANQDQSSRLYSLLQTLNINDRFINYNQILQISDLECINFEEVNNLLKEKISFSKQYLRDFIEGD